LRSMRVQIALCKPVHANSMMGDVWKSERLNNITLTWN
jgi:hypothetical protein